MTTGDKIAKLRRENNYTQEQLADIFGVSRQSISKWESGAAYPEVDKLIRMGELFGCTMDYLLRDEIDAPGSTSPAAPREPRENNDIFYSRRIRERTSTRRVRGLPLWQVGRDAHAVFAAGLRAIGKTQAEGSLFTHLGALGEFERAQVLRLLDSVTPEHLAWAKELVKLFL